MPNINLNDIHNIYACSHTTRLPSNYSHCEYITMCNTYLVLITSEFFTLGWARSLSGGIPSHSSFMNVSLKVTLMTAIFGIVRACTNIPLSLVTIKFLGTNWQVIFNLKWWITRNYKCITVDVISPLFIFKSYKYFVKNQIRFLSENSNDSTLNQPTRVTYTCPNPGPIVTIIMQLVLNIYIHYYYIIATAHT